ncbi:hypothetical protein CHCC5022_4216 [Bacillus paralicheniformis]|nr:hypothetical protein CHCC5022_4216 [Bacillus paralicheniformis]
MHAGKRKQDGGGELNCRIHDRYRGLTPPAPPPLHQIGQNRYQLREAQLSFASPAEGTRSNQ